MLIWQCANNLQTTNTVQTWYSPLAYWRINTLPHD